MVAYDDLLYVVNTTSQTFTAGQNITLPTVARKVGNTIQNRTEGVLLVSPGYYQVTGTITFTGAAGNAIIQLNKNGGEVIGGTTSATISTADTQVKTLPINAIVRVYCGESSTILTLENVGVSITISGANLSVIKV